MSVTELGSQEGQQVLSEVIEAFGNMSHTMGQTKQALLNLAEARPEALVQAFELGMRIQNMERASGKYSQTEDGRWKLNGRFISDPTKTKLYEYNKNLSDKARAKMKKELQQMRSRLQMYRLQGEISGEVSRVFGTVDTSTRLPEGWQATEKFVAPDGSIKVDKDTDLSSIEDQGSQNGGGSSEETEEAILLPSSLTHLQCHRAMIWVSTLSMTTAQERLSW